MTKLDWPFIREQFEEMRNDAERLFFDTQKTIGKKVIAFRRDWKKFREKLSLSGLSGV